MTASENIPIVLIHGWASSFKDTWQKTGIDALLGDMGRRVVGVDLLGHGAAPKPHDPEAYLQLPEYLLEVLEGEGPQVDAVGFSLGALTLLRAVTLRPERFRRVVLAGIGDGVFSPRDPNEGRRIVDALEGNAADGDTGALVFANYANRPGNDVVALTAIMKRPASPPTQKADLATFESHVLVVIGDKDFAHPATQLAAAFPQGKLVELRNTDHFATPESFAFIDVLLEFMAP
jgi:pimeloyl-ACP methyl ester carboxylesterase